jgi:hypothetical protein
MCRLIEYFIRGLITAILLAMYLCSIVNSNSCRTHTVKARPLLISNEKLMILDTIKKCLGFNVDKIRNVQRRHDFIKSRYCAWINSGNAVLKRKKNILNEECTRMIDKTFRYTALL